MKCTNFVPLPLPLFILSQPFYALFLSLVSLLLRDYIDPIYRRTPRTIPMLKPRIPAEITSSFKSFVFARLTIGSATIVCWLSNNFLILLVAIFSLQIKNPYAKTPNHSRLRNAETSSFALKNFSLVQQKVEEALRDRRGMVGDGGCTYWCEAPFCLNLRGTECLHI